MVGTGIFLPVSLPRGEQSIHLSRVPIMATSLPVLNLPQAKFECIFGRGCDGICCQNGRPGIYPEELPVLEQNLDKFLPELSKEARALVQTSGFLSRRKRDNLPLLRVINGWCVFFNN